MSDAATPPTALHRLRQSNAERVLDCLRRHGRLSRAEIAEHSGLSRTTLSTILSGLLRRGTVVQEEGRPQNRRGRPTALLTLNPSAGQYAGVELGRHRLRMVIADAAHQVQAREELPYGAARSAGARLALAERSLRDLAARHGITLEALTGIGVGSTGPGEAVSAPASGLAESVRAGRARVADRLARAFGVRVDADNNSRLTALAEATRSGAGGDLLYVHFSHGVGGGLIIGGQLVRGVGGVAAEVGHLCVDPGGAACWCGGHGCLELHASVPALLRTTGHRNWAVLRDALERGRAAEQEAVRAAGAHAGNALAAMCTAVNPGRIVLGGELADLGEAFQRPLRDALAGRGMRALRRIDISTSSVAPWGGALGGLALALRESPLLARYPVPADAGGDPDAAAGAQ
ncbi:ROK family transcriptional regulator [Saccharopolyspora sp. SCSIO 74807]|uniref:ROK family transcriptional regulator n=1 Tax=Saccharopolyspora sp. SCSIO 74807 TaxID=3118084 RepID=UPI0030D12479